jgi:ankyrin repeat protein
LQKKLPINDKTADGRTPLHLAVIGSQFSAVEFLLRMNATLEPQCRQGYTPLHEACGSDNADIVRLLLSAGAQAEALVAGELQKPIHIAASTGNVEIVQLLCEKGVAIDSRDSAGDRPLCIAASRGHTEVVEKLLEFNAPLRLPFGDRSYEDSPLCVAAKEGHLGVVSVLLQKGASIRQKDELGWPPIRYAAHYGHPDILELLLTQASIASDDVSGMSALDNIGEYVGFAAGSNLSEERKGRVRELLSQAEDQINAYMAERTIRPAMPGFLDEAGSDAAELDISLPDGAQATANHSQEMGVAASTSGLARTRTTFVPRQSDYEPPRYQPSTLGAFSDSKIDTFVSRPSSTTTVSDMPFTFNHLTGYKPPSRSNSVYNQPLRQSVSPQASPMPQLSPEEAALLIEDKKKEIARLKLFLPSIDEGIGHDVRYYAPVPAAYGMQVSEAHEMPS